MYRTILLIAIAVSGCAGAWHDLNTNVAVQKAAEETSRNAVAEAKELLNRAAVSDSSSEVKSTLSAVKELIAQHHIRLADLNTNEAELASIERRGYRQDPEFLLARIRKHAMRRDVAEEIETFREALAAHAIPPEEVDTSYEELEDLLEQGKTSLAKRWLVLARREAAKADVSAIIRRIRRFSELERIGFEELGTSVEELAQLEDTHK